MLLQAADQLASDLYQTLPHTKIVMLMRDPISRAISMLVHKKDVSGDGCLAERSMVDCLYNFSQISGKNATLLSVFIPRCIALPCAVCAEKWLLIGGKKPPCARR